MGCGMSRSHLFDEGVAVFGSRNPFHHKTHTASPKLLIKETSQPPIVHQPPVLHKINSAPVNHCVDDLNPNNDGVWIGSPSFRVYVQTGPGKVATTGDEQGKQTVIGAHEGEKLICNDEVCVWRRSNGEELADKKDTSGGRFRKVFQVHRIAFWHGGPWHIGHQPKPTPGHPKPTRNLTGA